ncbi:MAG: DUF4276 family protein [Deltaproteobacteria bacterium]|nr:DUF4276 family protein [Deltaproteobacteria bacterium]
MSTQHVEFLVEEPSCEAFLRLVLPKVIGTRTFEVFSYQCKPDLLEKLSQRLRGYAQRRRKDAWFRDHVRVVVLVDRDGEDCRKLKAELEKATSDEKLISRSRSVTSWFVLNRIAIEELEAWYFGDWEAVRAAFPNVPANIPRKREYRVPDGIAGGTWEAFERVMNTHGYFGGGLRKIEAARAIGTHIVPSRNTSQSFRAFRDALESI